MDRTASLYIVAHWDQFKVCQGCSAILKRRFTLCPLCKAYRFDPSQKAIRRQILRSLRSQNPPRIQTPLQHRQFITPR